MNLLPNLILGFAFGVVLVTPWLAYNIHTQNVFFGFKKSLQIEKYAYLYLFLMFVFMCAGGIGFGFLIYKGIRILRYFGFLFDFGLLFTDCIMVGYGCTLISGLMIAKWKQKKFFNFLKDDLPICEKCGYIIKGLPKLKGCIRCPECGHRESIRSVATRWRHEKKSKRAIEENQI